MCGNQRTMTGEHIYAAWIGRTVQCEATHTMNTLTLGPITNYAVEPTTVQTIEPGNHKDQTLGVLCAKCNNEWGSDIQTDVAPILKPFLAGEWQVLSDIKRQKIARWAASFAMVREFVHPVLVATSQETRQIFRETNEIPPGMEIWIAPFNGTSQYLSCHRVMGSPIEGVLQSTYTALTAATLGKIMIFVYHTQDPDLFDPYSTSRYCVSRCIRHSGMTQIWPTEAPIPAETPKPFDDQKFEAMIPGVAEAIMNPLSWMLGGNMSWPW